MNHRLIKSERTKTGANYRKQKKKSKVIYLHIVYVIQVYKSKALSVLNGLWRKLSITRASRVYIYDRSRTLPRKANVFLRTKRTTNLYLYYIPIPLNAPIPIQHNLYPTQYTYTNYKHI